MPPSADFETETPGSAEVQGEVDLIELFSILVKRRRLISKTILACAIIAVTLVMILPNRYTSVARILPPQQNQAASAAVLGQLGALSGLPVKEFGVKNISDLYVGMLQSRTVADAIIEGLSLQRIYGAENIEDARRRLAGATTVSFGKDGIIVVEVEEQDPLLSARIANRYVDELFRLNHTLAVTEASQRRLFFEKQLVGAREALGKAEDDMRKTQEATGLIHLDAQARGTVDSLTAIRAQIAAKEVQLSSMKSFAADQNPDLLRAERELTALRGQLARLISASGTAGDVLLPTRKVPGVGLEYLRKLREVKYYEEEFAFLSKQYELARIDEAKDSSIVQVLDRATPSLQKSSPRSLLILAAGVLIGAILGIMAAFVREFMERVYQSRETHGRLASFMSFRHPDAT